ncbi:hypothetical protein J6590_007817 [Homalodisca vitripennis]|nr:hypothetical protein J6590_007817 [Homalodisca vitripennis]
MITNLVSRYGNFIGQIGGGAADRYRDRSCFRSLNRSTPRNLSQDAKLEVRIFRVQAIDFSTPSVHEPATTTGDEDFTSCVISEHGCKTSSAKLNGGVTCVGSGEAKNTRLHGGTDSATAHAVLHPGGYCRPCTHTNKNIRHEGGDEAKNTRWYGGINSDTSKDYCRPCTHTIKNIRHEGGDEAKNTRWYGGINSDTSKDYCRPCTHTIKNIRHEGGDEAKNTRWYGGINSDTSKDYCRPCTHTIKNIRHEGGMRPKTQDGTRALTVLLRMLCYIPGVTAEPAHIQTKVLVLLGAVMPTTQDCTGANNTKLYGGNDSDTSRGHCRPYTHTNNTIRVVESGDANNTILYGDIDSDTSRGYCRTCTHTNKSISVVGSSLANNTKLYGGFDSDTSRGYCRPCTHTNNTIRVVESGDANNTRLYGGIDSNGCPISLGGREMLQDFGLVGDNNDSSTLLKVTFSFEVPCLD